MEMQKAPLFTSTKTLAHILSQQHHECGGQNVFRIEKQSLWKWGKRWKRSGWHLYCRAAKGTVPVLKDLVWYAPRTFYSDLKICQDSQFLLFHFPVYLMLIKYINCFCFWSICVKIERTSILLQHNIWIPLMYLCKKNGQLWTKNSLLMGVKADLSDFSL